MTTGAGGVRKRRPLTSAIASSVLAVAALGGTSPLAAQSEVVQPQWPSAGELFVGTNYQPVDRSPQQIRDDIAIMQRAGFDLVRIGDLSWDSFEPEEGRFTFELWDSVIAQLDAAGIKVLLDIPGSPAPIWLHKKYPGVDVITQDGVRKHPASRYMDNISDPDYRRLARRLADRILERYGDNPAVIAIGYDNEIGNGNVSYSDADRERFVAWLKEKYGTIEALNKAWATQRWSRRVNSWDEVDIPYMHGPGPNERNLDLRRYWSDDTIAALEELDASRQEHAPHLPTASNYWAYAYSKGFDYLKSWDKVSSYGAQGFYPGDPLNAGFEIMLNRAGHKTPVWLNEFTAGGGGHYGTPGWSRMWAYFGLVYYSQAFLAWTFNSHIGGEEQALFGLVDHDGRPSWKVDEFARIGGEFDRMRELGFPRYATPQVAIDFNFETFWLTNPPDGPNTMKEYYKASYWDQAKNAFEPFFKDNIDASVIDITHADLDQYKLIILPTAYIMDAERQERVRDFVADGGTVVMTGYSAKVDDTGKWFETPLPGGLTDVFGVRTNEFYRSPVALQISLDGETYTGSDPYFEVLEPSTATVLARFENIERKSPAITVNTFGKGKAIYLATASQPEFIVPLARSLYQELGIDKGPETPEGVVARVVDGRTLYVNTKGQPVEFDIGSRKSDVLTGKVVHGTLELPGFGVALLR